MQKLRLAYPQRIQANHRQLLGFSRSIIRLEARLDNLDMVKTIELKMVFLLARKANHRHFFWLAAKGV